MQVFLHVFSLELRKLLIYRAEFWTHLIGGVGVHLLLAVYLWGSLFEQTGNRTMGGYSYGQMIVYYLAAVFFEKAARGSDIGTVSQEIYDGSLNKFLLYPVNYFVMKFAAFLSYGWMMLMQLIAALVLIAMWGWIFESELALNDYIAWSWLLPSLLSATVAIYLYFTMLAVCELAAFWVDHVWSLHIVVRFLMAIFGGSMIPLQFFPEHWRSIIEVLPFSFVASVPARTLLGEVSVGSWFGSIIAALCWAVFLQLCALAIYRRGLRGYSGVGI